MSGGITTEVPCEAFGRQGYAIGDVTLLIRSWLVEQSGARTGSMLDPAPTQSR